MTNAAPDVPWIKGLFVKADRKEVVRLLRGFAADTDEDWYQVSGEAARVDLPFGPEAGYRAMEQKFIDITNKTWELSGYARVSTVRCDPTWIFVEQAAPLEGLQGIIEDWTETGGSIAVWSVDWFWHPSGALADVDEGFSIKQGFSYQHGGDFRWVEYIENIHDGRQFTSLGTPQPLKTFPAMRCGASATG